MTHYRQIFVAAALWACVTSLVTVVAGCTLGPLGDSEPASTELSPCTPCPPTASPSAPAYPGLGARQTGPPARPATEPAPSPYPPHVLTAEASRPTYAPPTPTPTRATTPLPLIPTLPLPTRTPVPLATALSGPPADELSVLLYVAGETGAAEMRALRMDAQGRVWDDRPLASVQTRDWFALLLPSRDGHWLAADSYYWRGGPTALHLLELDSGTAGRPLPEGAPVHGHHVGWEYGGALLLMAERVPPDDLLGYALLRVDAHTGTYHEMSLTPPDYNFGHPGYQVPALDPDGRRLVYAWHWQEEGMHLAEIWLLDLRSNGRVAVGGVAGTPHAFSWSPGGDRIAYLTAGPGPSYLGPDLYLSVLDLRSGNRRAIGTASGLSPLAWSPDGSRLAFVRVDHQGAFSSEFGSSGCNLYVLEVATAAVRRITDMEGLRISAVVWLPSGHHLAISVTDTREDWPRGEIWLVGAESGDMRALARPAQPFSPLAWLPAGE